MKRQPTRLTEGPIAKSLLLFAMPLLLGQLLQQLYNLADAWVVGNFAGNDPFAAVSSTGSLMWLIVGFFNGVAIGGGVVISKYYGARDPEMVRKAIHTNFLFGLIASAMSTAAGLLFAPQILQLMNTPDSVMPYAITYFRVYFGGVSTVIMYNICMSIMRAMGDSVRPLYYLILSSAINVVLDLLFVAVFRWSVAGAAIATVLSQGLSTVLCIIQMRKADSGIELSFRELKWDSKIMGEVLTQGLPTGVQNSVISIGNIVVQANINSFGSFAMSGHGAYSRIEGIVFLPVTCMSMALPTFVSQNLGAKEYRRAKQGALFGILFGMILAELIGFGLNLIAHDALRFFVDEEQSIAFGMIDIRTISWFFCLLAFSHCAAGVMRGCGKSVVPMATMLLFWCAVRITYVTLATQAFPVYNTICWAYPLTWTCSSVVFLWFLLKTDWTHNFEKAT